ncbi:trypco2 family protein [Micromonospora sp. NPDC005413]|uniref:trypco2 family protein n=1 Tax=Micromonospora sp. NPDC005413 TaxID=3154563 RepID=UPI0033AB168E
MTDLVSRIGLAEVLGELRDQLTQAQALAMGRSMRFEIQEAELEFTVAVSKETKPGAKVKIDVVAIGGFEAGTDATIGNSTTHRITLKLGVVEELTGQRAKVAESRQESWNE